MHTAISFDGPCVLTKAAKRSHSLSRSPCLRRGSPREQTRATRGFPRTTEASSATQIGSEFGKQFNRGTLWSAPSCDWPQNAAQQKRMAGVDQTRQGSRMVKCRRHICHTAVPHEVGNAPDSGVTETSGVEATKRWLHAFFKFSRPHTVLGTFISILSVSLLAMGPQDFGWNSLRGLLQALIPALLMNIHIVGLNQIFDVHIDKVNKPYLPLASGEFSMRTALVIVSVCGGAAVLMGVLSGSAPLLATLVGSAVLGVAYSVDMPFLRWKQYPLASAACILAVRAVLVQLGFYFHMRQVLGEVHTVVTRPLGFTIGFMLFFSLVIALFKDIPDVKGDSKAGVRTLSVRQGTSKVFWTCILLLEIAYAGAMIAGLASEVLWSRIATFFVHGFMGAMLFLRAKQTDLRKSKSIYSCYMFVWKLFYAEYLFIPLMR